MLTAYLSLEAMKGVILHMSLPDASWHRRTQHKPWAFSCCSLSVRARVRTHIHAHSHPVRSRQAASSRWLRRDNKSIVPVALKMAPFKMPLRSGCNSLSGIYGETPCTQHSVLRHNSSCVGRLCPLPSLFTVRAFTARAAHASQIQDIATRWR